jgi:hypothetical protein
MLEVAATDAPENHPDTDGTWVVYDGGGWIAGDPAKQDIYFAPLAGGETKQLVLPGVQLQPSINNGVITFVSGSQGSAMDVFAYVIATNTLYQITTTPELSESDPDVFVLPNGDFRLAWVTRTESTGQDIYAATVSAPGGSPYQVCLRYDPSDARPSGTYLIRLRLCDANGNNLSSPSLVLHAVNITKTGSPVPLPVDAMGNANPDNAFRYDAELGGYMFNISTRDLSAGTYNLNFTVGSSSTLLSAPFAIK